MTHCGHNNREVKNLLVTDAIRFEMIRSTDGSDPKIETTLPFAQKHHLPLMLLRVTAATLVPMTDSALDQTGLAHVAVYTDHSECVCVCVYRS